MTKKKLMTLTDSALNKTVKIAGTNYDRRRHLTNAQVANMKKMVATGKKTTAEVAAHFGVDPSTVRYNTEPGFKAYKNKQRLNYPVVKSTVTAAERAAYKRALLSQNCKVVVNE